MAPGYTALSGGHSLNMTYERNGSEVDNIAGCLTSGCHTDLTDFDYDHIQSEVQIKLDSIAVLLRKAGIMRAAPSTSGAAGTWSGDLAAAYVNWSLVSEDKSLGVHNPPYVTRVLQNTIEKLNTIVP
jgi:hypothetical protein